MYISEEFKKERELEDYIRSLPLEEAKAEAKRIMLEQKNKLIQYGRQLMEEYNKEVR